MLVEGIAGVHEVDTKSPAHVPWTGHVQGL